MKLVLLSGASEVGVYLVPDKVADNLEDYCSEFCCHWLQGSPNAAKYRVKMGNGIGFCYNEEDFIEYLNQYKFDEQSILVKRLIGVQVGDTVPEEYIGLPYFNF